ncbi:PepSY domain-containing protein [Chenggangzhangella methanolivorans]|uniref:PepSY domain-containing protein n=1 Tax=Chenggangzhangella methanolivorans TaxID=1437009 RepID=A0A9E6RAT0_9HYPH|nr:PepSY domain-containing protein [Chenggangzhangella methanolivorans]QZO00940.1 PepSY domain-containing protein [Chenggangzhangella methanolivorans]
MPKPLLALATALLVSLSAHAAFGDESDQDRARRALERGEIRPLDQVLDAARKALPGDVVKVELDEDDGRWTYEIKILTPSGERREVEIDAKSLRVLEID